MDETEPNAAAQPPTGQPGPAGLPASVLVLVPARSGSKGIPGKNIRPLRGKPLLAWSIEAGLRLPVARKRIVLSTDSREIADVGSSFGAEVPFLRPGELAADDTPMLDVVLHGVRTLEASGWSAEVVVLLQPTAPFRRDSDLLAALSLLEACPGADSVVSVERVPSHYAPHYVMKVEGNRLVPFLAEGGRLTRRQEVPPAYSRNGQFYMTRSRTLLEKHSIYGDLTLPFITTHKSVNLDTLEDWAEAERLSQTLCSA